MSEITYAELSKEMDKYFILDVRNAPELVNHGKIPGSHNISVNELEEAFDLSNEEFEAKYGFGKPKENEVIVTTCMIGGRARKAGDLLAGKGYSTRIYAGSFNDWKANGGEIEPATIDEPDN